MTKKLLPAMIGAALVAGVSAASADVTVFGHIDMSINNIDAEVGGVGDDDTNFHCTTCSIGFKGSEDLGNGLKAIFKLDFQYDMTVRNDGDGTGADGDNNNSGLLDRDQWVGLAGGFGKVRIGTISTGYKSHGAMIDPLYRTSLQGRDHLLQSGSILGLGGFGHSGAGENGEGRATNTIRWDSADFNGVKLVAHYTLDAGKPPGDNDGDDENPYGLGASYSNGGILVYADYITNDGSATNTVFGDVSAWQVGGKYTMGNIAVMGQYEDAEEDVTSTEGTLWHIAGSYTMGNNMLYAAYGQGELEVPGATTDTDSWTIAATHNMSKRTSVYAGYNNLEIDAPGVAADAETDQFSLGLKHKF